MIEIGPARESDVVLAFLKAEIGYSVDRQQIEQLLARVGITITVQELIEASTDNDYFNAMRAAVLDSYE